MEKRITTRELLELKKKYDTPEAFEQFAKKFSDNIAKYKKFSEFLLDSYMFDFNDKVANKILKHGNVEIVCKSMNRRGEETHFCTVVPEGKLPKHIGFEVPKEMFEEFILLSLTPLTDEELNKVRVVKLQL